MQASWCGPWSMCCARACVADGAGAVVGDEYGYGTTEPPPFFEDASRKSAPPMLIVVVDLARVSTAPVAISK